MRKVITINRLGLDKFLLTIKLPQGHPLDPDVFIIELTKSKTEIIAKEAMKALGDIVGYEIPNNKKGK